MLKIVFILLLLSFTEVFSKTPQKVHIAVASNFYIPLKNGLEDYGKKNGLNIIYSQGSSGKLFASIINGAPYDLFFSANREYPQKLVKQKLASNLKTYALGNLAIFFQTKNQLQAWNKLGPKSLISFNNSKIAIANSSLAPYGIAAVECLKNWGVFEQLENRLILGENISQTYQYIRSGGVEIGVLSLSQIKLSLEKGQFKGHYKIIDKSCHRPIEQIVVSLKDEDTLKKLIEYSQTNEFQKYIQKYGYGEL